jgi:hypothetical protein
MGGGLAFAEDFLVALEAHANALQRQAGAKGDGVGDGKMDRSAAAICAEVVHAALLVGVRVNLPPAGAKFGISA